MRRCCYFLHVRLNFVVKDAKLLFLIFCSTRRRLVKQKRVSANKIEKLLDVFPRLIFASGTGIQFLYFFQMVGS